MSLPFNKKLLFCLFITINYAFAVIPNGLTSAVKKLDQMVQLSIKKGEAIGCAIVVIHQGKVISLKAYGVKKKGEKPPIDVDTIFQLGSLSKPLTATLVAALKKQKLFSTKDYVSVSYPHISLKTQIFHILSHSSGYSRKGWNQNIEVGQTRSQLLKNLSNSSQQEPGLIFDYHNLAYSLIEEIIAKACQQPFSAVIKHQLFIPLNMNDTTVGFSEFMSQENRAWPHQPQQNNSLYPSKNYSHTYHDTVQSSGGINSNIQNMANFLLVQMGYKSECFSLKDLHELHTPFIKAPDAKNWLPSYIKGQFESYYSQGWRIVDFNKNRLIFHGGWLKGFRNFMGFIPNQDIGIIILHNGENNFSIKTAMIFLNELIKSNSLIRKKSSK